MIPKLGEITLNGLFFSECMSINLELFSYVHWTKNKMCLIKLRASSKVQLAGSRL